MRRCRLASRVHLALHEPGYKWGGAISRTPWAPTSTRCVHLRPWGEKERADYRGSYVLANTITSALPQYPVYSTARAKLRIANNATVKKTSVSLIIARILFSQMAHFAAWYRFENINHISHQATVYWRIGCSPSNCIERVPEIIYYLRLFSAAHPRHCKRDILYRLEGCETRQEAEDT